MNTIIIEPHDAWRITIESYIKQQASLTLLGSFNTILAAYHVIHTQNIDLILLNMDIQTSNPFDFSKGMNKSPLIILTKPQEGFKLNIRESIVVDVLTFPLALDRFNSAIEKTMKWTQHDKTEDYFYIRTNKSFVKIAFAEILYIKAMENFVQLVTRRDTYTKLTSLKKILDQLNSHHFMQVHRSFIVNLNEIKSVEKDIIRIDSAEIPVGSAYKLSLFEELRKKSLFNK